MRLRVLLALLLISGVMTAGTFYAIHRMSRPALLAETHPAQRAVVQIEADLSDTESIMGCGVMVAPGRILTAWHVIEGARSADAVFPDGSRRRIEGVLVGDERADQVVLAVQPRETDQHLSLASEFPAAGEPAVIVPSRVSYFARDTTVLWSGAHPEYGLALQLAGSPTQGMSGSPVIDSNGQLIGVVIRIADQSTFASAPRRALTDDQDAEATPIPSWMNTNSSGLVDAREDVVEAFGLSVTDSGASVRHANEALAAAPESFDVLTTAAYVFIHAGDIDRAANLAERARRIDVNIHTYQLDAIVRLHRSGVMDRDGEVYQLAAIISADDPMRRAAELHLRWLGEYRESVRRFASAAADVPHLVSDEIRPTVQAFVSGDDDIIRQDLKRVLDSAPEAPP